MVPNKVIVIGAGLAGLSAAITLQNEGVSVTVLESSDRPGGRVTSDVIDGFICDRGFQLINANYPEIQRLGIIKDFEFISASSVIEVARDDKRIRIGDPREAFFSVFNSETGSLLEKMRIIKYLLRRKNVASVGEEFKMNGIGKTYERVLRPFLTGVFLADPLLVNAEYGRTTIKYFVSGNSGLPEQGVKVFSESLASRVKTIEYGVQVNSIKKNVLKTSRGRYEADAIIVATDATTAAQLLDLTDVPQLVGCTTWYHSTNEAPTQSTSLIVDSQNRGPLVNTIVISNMVPSYAPAGKSLISSTSILPTTESEVRRHLAILYGTDTRKWKLVAKYEIPSALPLSGLDHDTLSSAHVRDSIYIAGDYKSAPSQNGALLSGRLAALSVLVD
ncbi:MAG: FAD-dependent oxidoreductase [Actinobacteria bacterium]|nr:FAD-dependent oxidoreductase [Actinomycetota bacterium]MSX70151.1 FAD-dependent oxidoreductase [Actinomycetota bacterium]